MNESKEKEMIIVGINKLKDGVNEKLSRSSNKKQMNNCDE